MYFISCSFIFFSRCISYMYFECMFLYNCVIIIQVHVMYNVFVEQIKMEKKVFGDIFSGLATASS